MFEDFPPTRHREETLKTNHCAQEGAVITVIINHMTVQKVILSHFCNFYIKEHEENEIQLQQEFFFLILAHICVF